MQANYSFQDGCLRRAPDVESHGLRETIWIDLMSPTADEEARIEAELGYAIPTRADMAEIEDSARLFEEGGAATMTAVVIDGAKDGKPTRVEVSFILTKEHLLTIRYADPAPFGSFAGACDRKGAQLTSPESVLVGLLGSIVAQAADELEEIGNELSEVSGALFLDNGSKRSARRVENRLQVVMRRLGRRNMEAAILRESFLSLDRLISYLRLHAGDRLSGPVLTKLKQIDRDVHSLSAHEAQITLEISYLHDATLGLINLDQTRIIKAFSIAAVLFLPPTLVGTVYGMNFKGMPELEWAWGYPLALALMLGSAAVPYLWFRHRGWL